MTSPEDVLALARAVLDAVANLEFLRGYRCCPYCRLQEGHKADCPVPIAQRVIAEGK